MERCPERKNLHFSSIGKLFNPDGGRNRFIQGKKALRPCSRREFSDFNDNLGKESNSALRIENVSVYSEIFSGI